MKLLFVGDGPRDEAVLPEVVSRAIGMPVHAVFSAWKDIRLNRGSGYGKKLKFAVRQARDWKFGGVVAVVDQDRDPIGARLRVLAEARSADRNDSSQTVFPTAVGEAVPHLESWLLDDEHAVRQVLKLSPTMSIPNVARCKNPKASLHDLYHQSSHGESEVSVLSEIAKVHSSDRCRHATDTGLDAFLREVKTEFAQHLA